MKYVIINNKDWDYDDLVQEELLLFSVPDGFNFTDEVLLEYFRDECKYPCIIEKGWVKVHIPKGGAAPYWFKIESVLDFDQNHDLRIRGHRQKFIDWLKKYDVHQLDFELFRG